MRFDRRQDHQHHHPHLPLLQGGEVGKQTRRAAAEVKGIAGGRAEFDLISHNIFFGDIIPLQTLIEQLKAPETKGGTVEQG